MKKYACIIDIDGTIADESLRRRRATDRDGDMNWRKYFRADLVSEDIPIKKAREVLRWIKEQGCHIIYLSSREDKLINATKDWLLKHSFPGGDLRHRKKFQKTDRFKVETIQALQRKYEIIFGIGDRDGDIEAYRACGIIALRVDTNQEKDWDRIRQEIQKLV